MPETPSGSSTSTPSVMLPTWPQSRITTAATSSLAAVIGRSIIQGHPLQDGNKRLGILLMTLFLSENGLRLQASEKEIAETALSLARGTLDFNGLRSWLEAHTCREKIFSEEEG